MSGLDDLVVRAAAADEVRPLRMAVLRPDQPVVPAEYDERPDTRHVAALAGGAVVGCASVFPSPYDGEPRAWQLRGMAVAPGRQGTGIGARVLLGAIDVARASGAPLLWANARVTALGFYERLGFEVVGEEYLYGPAKLPHKIIRMRL
ncbi:MAG TPA: GNAT family N-acetyltransferase [Mycobacteriales bacterium]|nr:GNAT family N-acetyltransferase [Mycobacteriales bacterium]